MLNDIDDDYIESAGRDLEHYRGAKSNSFINEKTHRKSVWRKAAAAALCTAAAIFGVFALLLGTGRIKLETGSDGAGVSLNASSSGLYFPISDEYQLNLNEDVSGNITVNSAYGYEENSEKIRRYEIGEKFGETAEITAAKATFLIINKNAILTAQEISLSEEHLFQIPVNSDKIDIMTALGYPSFGDDFSFTIEITHGDNAVNLPESGEFYVKAEEVGIYADYGSKTVNVKIKCLSTIHFWE